MAASKKEIPPKRDFEAQLLGVVGPQTVLAKTVSTAVRSEAKLGFWGEVIPRIS